MDFLEKDTEERQVLSSTSHEDENRALFTPPTLSARNRKWRVGKAGVVALVMGTVMAMYACGHATLASWQRRHSSLSNAKVGAETLDLAEVKHTDAGHGAPAPPPACALIGKSCLESKCCATPGMQCYQKEKHGWAACRTECTAGRDPIDKNPSPWDCKPLGKRTPGVAPPPDFSIKPAAWVGDECSASGEDCSTTKCCKEAGAQCYRKTKGWSACKAECTPGPDPTDADNHPWECEPLGMRTPGPPSLSLGQAQDWVADKCAGPGEQCLHKKCCKQAGEQCFKKHDSWAMCMDKCTPGPLLTDRDPAPWNCSALGGRTPGIPTISPNVKIAPWVQTKCSKVGENCEKSQCCRNATMQCYAKAPGWATCMNSCQPGVHAADKVGGAWSCKALGPRTPRPWGYPSLYCLSVIMLTTYEADIMRQALQKGGLGIFACELYNVFSQDGETVLGDGPLGQVRTHHFQPAPVTRSVDGTAGNAALFANVWAAVKLVGAYKLTDWTIKADPDAVIFPDRLRGHLKAHTGPVPKYIVNCNKPGMSTGPMMFGSVEAMNRAAMEKYFASGTQCYNNFQYGEDRWLGVCFQQIGVLGESDFGMVGDGVCTGGACSDGKAAYHPFKSATAWIGCYYAAVR